MFAPTSSADGWTFEAKAVQGQQTRVTEQDQVCEELQGRNCNCTLWEVWEVVHALRVATAMEGKGRSHLGTLQTLGVKRIGKDSSLPFLLVRHFQSSP